MLEQFARTELMIGSKALTKLECARVAVFGLGGVGSYTVEALARSGIGALDLIDHDCISLTNINRQIIATLDTIGKPKVEVETERIKSINPRCKVTTHQCFYLPETADQFDFTQFDYIVDAVDTVTAKLQIIEQANQAHVPVISSMGTAFKLDPTAFRVADIYETRICPLAKIIRKECRKRGIESLKVVYSTEPPHEMQEMPNGGALNNEPVSRHGIPGSISFVPSVAGLILAGETIKDLAGVVD